MAVNPHFINDAVICLENGTVNCWRDGVVKCFSDHQIHSHPNCDEIRWVNCIYGTNPTSFLLLHPRDVYMYDTRVRTCSTISTFLIFVITIVRTGNVAIVCSTISYRSIALLRTTTVFSFSSISSKEISFQKCNLQRITDLL